mmetsp:Transcript_39536/g.53715  ORF Transcript_39536/g.53715 Transcript_39536/m.53715 type:complete len:87 (-) Transcript_39536:135-395(-)
MLALFIPPNAILDGSSSKHTQEFQIGPWLVGLSLNPSFGTVHHTLLSLPELVVSPFSSANRAAKGDGSDHHQATSTSTAAACHRLL